MVSWQTDRIYPNTKKRRHKGNWILEKQFQNQQKKPTALLNSHLINTKKKLKACHRDIVNTIVASKYNVIVQLNPAACQLSKANFIPIKTVGH